MQGSQASRGSIHYPLSRTTDKDQITELVEDIAKRARKASLELATLPTETKNDFLRKLADRLVAAFGQSTQRGGR